jgi:predicted nuclease of predicted toxin-antitoxin system
MSAVPTPRMTLLIDENVPNSVAQFFIDRGHSVSYVRDVLPAGTPDPVIARIGDRLSAIVVTWDRDFETIIKRIPQGNKNAFRRLGRISFKCAEPKGKALLIRWVNMIELHFAQSLTEKDFRMIVQIQESGIKFS